MDTVFYRVKPKSLKAPEARRYHAAFACPLNVNLLEQLRQRQTAHSENPMESVAESDDYRDVMILFGGQNSSHIFDDIWIFDIGINA